LSDKERTVPESPEGVARVIAVLLAVGVWCAWWLGGTNWKKAWPVLAEGGWVPVVLLMVMSSLAWTVIAPGPCDCLGFVTIPGGWWQLGTVCALAGLALLCGWLQGLFGWTPPEVRVEPPPAAHDDPLLHAHGHEADHH
jgi:hypothetical protein